MAKINQTQRNYMLDRFNSTCREVLHKKLKTVPEKAGEGPLEKAFDKKYGNKWCYFDAMVDAFKDFQDNKKAILKEQSDAAKINSNRDKIIDRNAEIEAEFWKSMKPLRDELMLGNDLTDLQNILKKVQGA